jgi:enterochelin esterase-like enzyme
VRRGRATGLVNRGRVVELTISSRALKGNRLKDPTDRVLPVYLPPAYDREPDRRFPVAFYLAGFMGVGQSQLNWKPWSETLPQRLDRLQAEGRIGPVIVAFPDCFTRLGGSQYINSSVCGAYADHLVRELVPLVDAELRTGASREHRAVFGKSSGGFGAMVHGMLYPETWGAAACHSGDAYFDFCFATDLPRTAAEVGRHGSIAQFLSALEAKHKRTSAETHALMQVAMAACFDPQPRLKTGFELPVDLHTGQLKPERWQRWLDWDPVRMIPDHVDALKSLRCLFLDCGSRDQYHLQFGGRQMAEALKRCRVRHTYEEFADNHSSIDYRMDVSLPRLYEAIAAGLV